MTQWLPPNRPPNESAGYLGYYTRVHLPVEFDLVDLDGADPVQWIYWKRASRTFRVIEEKPLEGDWKLHKSQERGLRILVSLVQLGIDAGTISEWSGVYVLQGASQLVEPSFPITVRRLSASEDDDENRSMQQDEFDKWLCCNGSPS